MVPPLPHHLPLSSTPRAASEACPRFVFSGVKSFAGSQPWPCRGRSWTFWSVMVGESPRGGAKWSEVCFGYSLGGWVVPRCICLKLLITLAMPPLHTLLAFGSSSLILKIHPFKSILLLVCLNFTNLKAWGNKGRKSMWSGVWGVAIQ